MTAVRVPRWSRFFVTAGAVAFVLWQLGLLAGLPRRVSVCVGACLFAGIVIALFYERHWQKTLQTVLPEIGR